MTLEQPTALALLNLHGVEIVAGAVPDRDAGERDSPEPHERDSADEGDHQRVAAG